MLTTNDDVISIETPIWKKVNNSDLFFTGHIDLLMVKNDMIYVCDYKQNIYEIYKSVPQVAGYGIMLNDILKNYSNVQKFRIRCLSFCDSYAMEFDPESIHKEIEQFAHLWHKTTGKPIFVKGTTRRLMEDIKKLICIEA